MYQRVVFRRSYSHITSLTRRYIFVHFARVRALAEYATEEEEEKLKLRE